jgi:drug/metabolite transporter (DMT)-like permease
MMDEERGRDTRRLALATGIVAAGSAACLATYFAVQGPFGTINDIGNAAAGILSGCLAWRLRREGSGPTDALVGAALAGAALTVVGSALVVSGTTGFFLAGLVSSVGYAGIGAWLVALSRSSIAATWSPRLRMLGLAAGALMALGVVMIPGIFQRLDDMATAPAWVWIGFLGWLGTFVAYPAWAIWLGVARTRTSGTAVSATGGARP